MKKFLLLLTCALLFAIAGHSQDKSYTLKPDGWFQSTTFGTADTITNTDDIYSVEYLVNKPEPVKYNFVVNLSKISGSPQIVCKLQGKVFPTDSYADITSVTWYGTTSDTTIKYVQNSTAQYYRLFRLYLDATATAQKSQLTTATAKFWDK